jgi:quercetin dioxygenase-like cupin family protein
VEPRAAVERWEDPALPDAGELRRLMESEGMRPYSWSNGPGDRYATHSHGYDKIIYVVSGSITFILPEMGDELALNPGDRLSLPAGVLHKAVVGPQGVVCLEAQHK